MVWLPNGEKNKICLFFSTEYTNVTTDEQTDGHRTTAYRPRVASRGRNVINFHTARILNSPNDDLRYGIIRYAIAAT